jgi:hypothetical protein
MVRRIGILFGMEDTFPWALIRAINEQSEQEFEAEHRILLTSQYTLLAPLRFHLYRQVRLKAASLGCDVDLHEEQVLHSPSGTLEREENFPL